MATKLPTPIPQIPVSDLERAISFYRTQLGFTLDWKYDDGIAGESREEARLFLDRVVEGPLHPVRVWLNLHSVSEVDALHRDWHIAGVPIPKLLLQEIVSHYSRSAERPSGINLDDPVALPARIREIHVERGQAVIVQ